MFVRRFTSGAPRGPLAHPGGGLRPAPRRAGARRRRVCLAALLCLAATPPPLAAQRLFNLGAWTGFAELRFDVREQETGVRDGRDTSFDRELTEERLSLRNTLTVVDRKFLTVNFGLTLGLTQNDVVVDERQERNDGALKGLDLTATFRPASRHAATLLFSRAVTETPIDFVGLRELATRSLGLNVGVGPAWLPGSIRIRESELESTSDLGRLVRAVDHRRRRLEYTAANRWPRHELNLFYLIEDLEDRVAPDFSHLSQNFTVSHGFEVLAPRLATLRSVVRYYDRGGTLATSSLYLDELLRLQHRKNLASSLRYVAQQLDSFSGPPSDSQQLVAELNHRLYDSLETDVFLARNRTTSPTGRTDFEEVGVDAVYTKKLPGGAELRARFNSRYGVRDSLRGDGQELVRDERHVARFGVPARLERPGVIAGSVVVTDTLRATLYEEGVDYELLLIGDFAEITPLEGGRIRDGQVILVEYRIEAPGAAKYTERRDSFDLSLDFGWITPFWGFRTVDNRLVEGTFNRLLNDRDERLVGVRFRRDGRRLSLVSFNELRHRDSPIQSFESLRLGQNFIYRPWRRWTVRLHLARQATDFTIPLRETRASEGRLRIRWAPNPTLSLESYASLRTTEDTLAADQSFERFGLEGRWTFGKITVLANLERWRRGREQDGVELEQLSGLSGSLRISRRFFPGRLSVPRRRPAVEPWPANLPGLWSQPAPGEEMAESPEAAPHETAATSPAASNVVIGDPAEWEALCRDGLEDTRPIAVSLSALDGAAMTSRRAEVRGSRPDAPRGDAEAAVPEPEDGEWRIRQTVAAWARAWADRRVQDYLSFYAAAFRPEGSLDRASWERQRRDRLTRPWPIRVDLLALDVEVVEPRRARARFRQSYRSEVFADVVTKTLELTFEGGGWKILRERVDGPLAGP